MTVRFKRIDGSSVEISDDTLQAFKAALRGALLAPGDVAYDEARQVWNAMIDRRPALIARCSGTVDAVRCVQFAHEHRIVSSVRGGGHHIAGLAVPEGGLMIDLAPMRGVWVDRAKRTCRAQAGCTRADVDCETQWHGLAAVLGFVSATGIAGLTVGGGFGHLTRRHGWTCDNLVSIDTAIEHAQRIRAPHSAILMFQIGGAAQRHRRQLHQLPQRGRRPRAHRSGLRRADAAAPGVTQAALRPGQCLLPRQERARLTGVREAPGQRPGACSSMTLPSGSVT
jgi:hypothetical protein